MKLILRKLLRRTSGGGYDVVAGCHRRFRGGIRVDRGYHLVDRGRRCDHAGRTGGAIAGRRARVPALLFALLLLLLLLFVLFLSHELFVLFFWLFDCNLKLDLFGLLYQVRIIAERRTMAGAVGDCDGR